MNAASIYKDLRHFFDYEYSRMHPSMELRVYLDEQKTKEIEEIGFSGCYLIFYLRQNENHAEPILLLPPVPPPLFLERVPCSDARGESKRRIGFSIELSED